MDLLILSCTFQVDEHRLESSRKTHLASSHDNLNKFDALLCFYFGEASVNTRADLKDYLESKQMFSSLSANQNQRRTTRDFANSHAFNFPRFSPLAWLFRELRLAQFVFHVFPSFTTWFTRFTSFHYLLSVKAPGTASVKLGLFAKRGCCLPYHFSSVVVP